ncbi:serine-threonine kinase [Yersinia phage fPS-53]|uniref:Protein kinase n=4 Tax=Helsettvirus TaxID=2732684 RepID=A0A2H1UKX5_9CAUD|nr:serine-threonine kinase [Yersinia phage fPS-53]YP_009799181.1 serine-threonine kinase [Yersinia phage fPS-54-ocr]SOO46588.1 protein kinase [Yersinia phage fPS-89]SOO56421.1 protein kinase [Yersinia phage fPS-85]SOO56470.1 protein kinase [Yersinia phage fPS-53]SOP75971.1 protein kinase [Yersinia phage fPS-54-ocr]
MNTQPTLTFSESLQVAYSELKTIPIDLLDTRQERLVYLLVSIVNRLTGNGKSTLSCTEVVDQEYWCNLLQMSEEVGFKYLGAGHFSAAFSHPMLPKRAIKIGFKKEDSGAAYTAWCRANQGRAGVPVIHAVSRSAGCYSVVLDHLHEFTYQKSVTDYYEVIRDVINGDVVETWDNLSIELVKTSQDIRKFFKGIAEFDIHRGNVMIHPDTGHVVITDPVSFSEDLATTEAPLDFDALVKEIVEAHAAELIRKAKPRQRMEKRR